MAERWAVEAVGLSKRYGETPALREVDLRVGWGERVALFGPNGAGKSTLLRLLAMLLRPTGGALRLAGCAPEGGGTALRGLVGFLGHQGALYPDLTVEENLTFYARLYRLPGPERSIAGLLERLDLARRRHDRVRSLSRGLQQRAALARALLHDPPILLLDEPDTGLDAPGRGLLTRVLAERDRTVLLSTHQVEAGREWAARAIVLVGGRLVHDGPTAGLTPAALGRAYADGGPGCGGPADESRAHGRPE